MKKIIGVALILVVVLFALPFVVRQAQDTGQDPQPTAQEEAALPDSGHTLRVKGSDGQVTEMDLNQYLWGVVAAEMPASFSQEALKAQAVAARTYALNKGPSFNHPDADLCTDYACCQAWIARGNWGDKAAEYTNKITTAVAETGNQVILYQGQLIDAVFHSSSSAATQDAVEVWGNSVPYLQSVDSPEGEGVPNYESQVTLTTQEFKDAFLKAQGIPGLWGIDTRALTKVIRESGVMNGMITTDLTHVDMDKIHSYRVTNAVESTSVTEMTRRENPEKTCTVALMDYGYKENIRRELEKRGAEVIVCPYNTTADELKALNIDGVMLSNGPGDPADNIEVIENLKKIMNMGKPLFGICLGHQLLALANGFVAVSGALYANLYMQYDNTSGSGKVVLALASVIIGITVFSKVRIISDTTAVIFGAIIYSLCLNYLVLVDSDGIYLKLLNAVMFAVILIFNEKITDITSGKAKHKRTVSEK